MKNESSPTKSRRARRSRPTLGGSEADRHARAQAVLVREIDLRRIVGGGAVQRLRVGTGRLEHGTGEKAGVLREIKLQRRVREIARQEMIGRAGARVGDVSAGVRRVG